MANSRALAYQHWDTEGLPSKGKPRGSIQVMGSRVTMEFCNEQLRSANKNFSFYLMIIFAEIVKNKKQVISEKQPIPFRDKKMYSSWLLL